ncbi:hypothetical protein [Chryseobacterium oryctis]|uniref:HEAT repeat-containing protein n=1 Tax=Chryseobacterium oryctis TaxID=2952618 RepID=A0ABT3HLF2_9FLAO|nr:hypothetical protein [Chryseobacterium oryctis]MCW3160622.1 hypothetical protein [Chryseobacterium oryctis]
MNDKAENLVNELFDNPIKFNNNKFKGYELLEEFQKGLDLEVLILILKSDDPHIYNIGISIASELTSSQCSYLILHLIPLLKKVNEQLNFYYLLEAIFKGSYEREYNKFVYVTKIVEVEDIDNIDSAMYFISMANNEQIQACYKYYSGVNNETMKYGLLNLLNFNKLDFDSIMELIKSDQSINQIFGVIIAKKVYDIYPELITESSLSINEIVKNFAQNVLEDNEEIDY